MTPQIMTCLAILVVAVALFSWDRIAADVVALGVMLALLLAGLLTPEQAFAGFGSSTVMMILGFFIMTAALSHTGIVDTVGRIRMRLGDVLLLQGRPEDVKELERGNLFNIFGGVDTERLRTSHAALAVSIFAAALVAMTAGIVSLPVAALGGAFLMLLGQKPSAKTCEALEGLIREAEETMGEIADAQTLDAAIISSAQTVEHYEIARYGTLACWAAEIGNTEIAELLEQTLEEEKSADETLSTIAEDAVNQRAAA